MSKKNKRIVFVLGANLKNPIDNIRIATKLISKELFLKKIKFSKILKNKALLKPNSPKEWNIDFYNLALSGEISDNFSFEEILFKIKDIEKKLGRQKREKWAPREIDIDIALIDHLRINLKNKLIIPHLEIFHRDFFIKTIKEIEPSIINFFLHKKELLLKI